MNVSGVISGLVASGSCPGLVGTQITLGPATTSGTVSFKATHSSYGVGPAGQVSGSSGNYTVGMNDGYPGDTDYNDVILSIAVSCPPANDSILDHPDFKSRFDSLMKLSNISAPVGSRNEWAFNVYRDSTSAGGIRLGQPTASGSECGMNMPAPIDPTIMAVVHSHPHFKGDNMVTACGKQNAIPYNPGANGGGSEKDWAYQRQFGIDVYAITPEESHLLPRGSVAPLVPNPYRWKRTINACWIP